MEIAARIDYLKAPLADIWTGVTVIGDEQLILIDTATQAAVAQTILPALKARRYLDGRPALIINTHCHCDHIGGNAALRRELHARIAAHHRDAPFITNHRQQFEALFGIFQADPELAVSWSGFSELAGDDTPVDLILDDGLQIKTGYRVLQVLDTPGHSVGSIALFDAREGILFAGDSAQCDGTTDTKVPMILDAVAYRASINRLRICSAGTLVVDHPFKPYRDSVLSGPEVDDFLRDCLLWLDHYADLVREFLTVRQRRIFQLREVARYIATRCEVVLNPYVCMLAGALLDEQAQTGTIQRQSRSGYDPDSTFTVL